MENKYIDVDKIRPQAINSYARIKLLEYEV